MINNLIKLKADDLRHTMPGMWIYLFQKSDQRQIFDYSQDEIIYWHHPGDPLYTKRCSVYILALPRDYMIWTARRVFEILPWANCLVRDKEIFLAISRAPLYHSLTKKWLYGIRDYTIITIPDIFRGLPDDQAIVSRQECEVKDDERKT